MSEQKDRPMPGISFKVMSLLLSLYHRFAMDVAKELGKAGIREGQTVLDYGCGPGDYTIAAARAVGEGGRVYAIDIHPLAVRRVEERASKEGLTNITTVLSDRHTGLPDRSIDVALAYDMIHMVKNKRALLEEMHRILKPDGLLSIWVGHMKVEDVSAIAEQDGLFTLKDRRGRCLNFEKAAGK